MKRVNGVTKKQFSHKKMRVLAAAAAAMMLSASCALAQPAVIDNGSDPAVLLSVHEQPDSSALAVGRFVSGTQVEILGEAGGWSQIAIGMGSGVITGYARADCLDDSVNVDATRSANVVSPYGTQSVVLRSRPSNSYDAVAMLTVGDSVLIIGEMDDFRFVRTASGCVGCLLASELR